MSTLGTKTCRVIVPLLSAFALTGGPALSTAWVASHERAEMLAARQKAAADHRHQTSPDAGQDSEESHKTPPPSTSCLVAAGAAKPVDHHGFSSGAAILCSILQDHDSVSPGQIVPQLSRVIASAQHYPAYLSHAPPVC